MVGVLKPFVSEHKPEQSKHSVLVKLFALFLLICFLLLNYSHGVSNSHILNGTVVSKLFAEPPVNGMH